MTEKTISEAAVAILEAKTEDCREGLQYVLIRGLTAMGFAQPLLESYDLAEAAAKAILAKPDSK